MSKNPTSRDYARESALRGFDSVMSSLRSIIVGLEPHQSKLVQMSGQGGPTQVSQETFLQELARVALGNIQKSLASQGFMRVGPQPKQQEQAPEQEPAEPQGPQGIVKGD